MVQGNFVNRGCLGGARFMPASDFRRRNQQASNRGQSWSVQRLANVANGFRPAGMAVEKTAACGKIEHRKAKQHCSETLQGSCAQQ